MEKTQYSEATNKSEKLAARIAINQASSSLDFQSWLQEHVSVSEGADVLDVACGTGAQTVRYLERVGPKGTVCAIDASNTSIELIKKDNPAKNLTAIVGDMMNLSSIIRTQLPKKAFDVISCSYALYYAADPTMVLNSMLHALKPNGKMAICVPMGPHGLVELVRKYASIPEVVDESLQMGPKTLEPFFAEHFDSYSVAHLRNKQTFTKVSTVIESLENAAYFDPSIRSSVEADIAAKISADGAFVFFKKSFLIVGEIKESTA